MSEIKRVALNTLEAPKVSDKVNKKLVKTIRISVILPESNEDKCPEYNYKDQLALAKKRLKVGKELTTTENGLDPFNDNDDDVKRIAFEMEAKYGAGMMKKKRKGRKDDYADIGMGYDESDSFIDNTDGYDEIIPQNVTTLHGGFYINCGALEFKTDDEASSEVSSSDQEGDKEQASSRKRTLDSSDESETDSVVKKPKITTKNSMQLAIKKKLFSQNKIQVKKRRPLPPFKKPDKELSKEKHPDLGIKENEENLEKESLKENKKPMSITSVTDAIESVVKQIGETDYDNNQNKPNATDVHKKVDSTTNGIEAALSMEGESSQEKTEIVKLPENLPPDILELVNKITQAAIEYKGETKTKFFSNEINTALLSLERKCKILGKSSRVRIHEHLAGYIKCRKETVSRRAKILMIEDEKKRLKRLTIKLKDVIDNVMPGLLANFEQESQKILQKKFASEGTENEDVKSLKLPRRKFSWNDDSKKLLKDILNLKKRILLLEGKQKDNLEETITEYLRKDVLTLWPEGWMFVNSLKKVYNSMTENNNSKLANSTPSSSNSSKHSSPSISITPVISSKTNETKHEVTNKITVTKVNNNVKEEKESAKNEVKTIKGNEMNDSFTQLLRSIEKDFKKEAKHHPKALEIIPATDPYKKRHYADRDDVFKELDLSKPSEKPSQNEVLKLPADSSVIVVNTHASKDDKDAVIHKEPPHHCHLIDLTEKNKNKSVEMPPATPAPDYFNPSSFFEHSKKFPINYGLPPSTPNKSSKSEGDDIQMVMENLKALQKLSCSPAKNENSTGSPVSVIAFNKSGGVAASTTRVDKDELQRGFQDEFQKQFINSLQQLSASATSSNGKSNYRCS